jgi:hypothetical protein
MPKSLFTRRHYRFIAQAIKGSRSPSNIIDGKLLIMVLVATLRMDNPRFDADAFRAACGEQPAHSD